MWSRKLINRINRHFSLKECSDESSVLFFKGQLECLDPKLLSHISIKHACVSTLPVELANISQYVRFNHYVSTFDLQTTKVDLTAWSLKAQSVTVEQFFQDVYGHTHSSYDLTWQFKYQCLKLLSNYQTLQDPGHGTLHYNVRLLYKWLQHCGQLAESLRLYSLHQS